MSARPDQRVQVGRVRPFPGRAGCHRLDWTISVGDKTYKKSTSHGSELELERFRLALRDAAERGAHFSLEDGCAPGVSRPAAPSTSAGEQEPAAARRPLLYDIAARHHARLLPAAGRRRRGNTGRSDADALVMIGEALLRSDAPALSPEQRRALREHVRWLLTPPEVRARIETAGLESDRQSEEEFAKGDKTPQQKSRRRRNIRAREARRQQKAEDQAAWQEFYEVHGLTWAELDDRACARVLARLRLRTDDSTAEHNTVARRSGIFQEHVAWAIRRKLLPANPIDLLEREERNSISVETPRPDARRIVNVTVGKSLIAAAQRLQLGMVGEISLFAVYIALMLLAGLRPGEARALRYRNLHDLPESGWGLLVLEESLSAPGYRYTGEGQETEVEPLKHRGEHVTRPVPIPPSLVKLLRPLAALSVAPDDRIFAEALASPKAWRDFYSCWAIVKAHVFSAPHQEHVCQKLRTYDLRHARASHLMSTNHALPEALVASWLGHSVDTLRKTYQGVVNVGTEDWAQERAIHVDDLVPPTLRLAGSEPGRPSEPAVTDGEEQALLGLLRSLPREAQEMVAKMIHALS